MTEDRMTEQPTEVEVRAPRVDDVGLVLPADWWTIDLRSDEAIRRSVGGLVERQLGRADVQASLRADARHRLVDAATSAARAGGRLMAVSLMQAAGLPISLSLTVYRVPGGGVPGTGLADVDAAFRSADGRGVEPVEGTTFPAVRRVSERTGPAELGAADVPMLVADYWVDPGGEHGLLLLTFSTPLLALREGMLELFDAVVATVAPAS
jgi:hypothetical protein